MTPEEHLAAALGALGFLEDPEAEGTPERVAALLREFAPGAEPVLETFESPGPDPVLLRGLPFHSLCAHHLLPFFGEADIAYRADQRIAGLGGIARALRHFARQPQLQERLGAQLAGFLADELGAPVLVRLRARQMCMEMRGAESTGTVETLALRGPGAEGLVALL
jgi:GTP cyclohydrolase I